MKAAFLLFAAIVNAAPVVVTQYVTAPAVTVYVTATAVTTQTHQALVTGIPPGLQIGQLSGGATAVAVAVDNGSGVSANAAAYGSGASANAFVNANGQTTAATAVGVDAAPINTPGTPATTATPVIAATPVTAVTPATTATPVTTATPATTASPVTTSTPVTTATPATTSTPVTTATPVSSPTTQTTTPTTSTPTTSTPTTTSTTNNPVLSAIQALTQATTQATLVTKSLSTSTSTSSTATTSSQTGLLNSFEASILNEHNVKRRLHGASDLVWNAQLAQYAANYAASSFSCDNVQLIHSGGPYGENLAAGYVGGASPVDAWYDEIQYYDYNNPGFSEATGHFTQVIWKSTSEVGCAYVTCNNIWRQYTICEYANQRGNIVGTDSATGKSYFAENVLPLV